MDIFCENEKCVHNDNDDNCLIEAYIILHVDHNGTTWTCADRKDKQQEGL